jgi:hypothetical protein
LPDGNEYVYRNVDAAVNSFVDRFVTEEGERRDWSLCGASGVSFTYERREEHNSQV